MISASLSRSGPIWKAWRLAYTTTAPFPLEIPNTTYAPLQRRLVAAAPSSTSSTSAKERRMPTPRCASFSLFVGIFHLMKPIAETDFQQTTSCRSASISSLPAATTTATSTTLATREAMKVLPSVSSLSRRLPPSRASSNWDSPSSNSPVFSGRLRLPTSRSEAHLPPP